MDSLSWAWRVVVMLFTSLALLTYIYKHLSFMGPCSIQPSCVYPIPPPYPTPIVHLCYGEES